MQEFHISEGRVSLRLRLLFMGADICILLDGGDTAHIGAVSVCHAEQVHVYCLPTHREDELSKYVSMRVKGEKPYITVSCLCGIHLDNITREEIDIVYRLVDILIQDCINYLK